MKYRQQRTLSSQTKINKLGIASQGRFIGSALVGAMLLTLSGCDNSNNTREAGSYRGATDNLKTDAAALQLRMEKQFDR